MIVVYKPLSILIIKTIFVILFNNTQTKLLLIMTNQLFSMVETTGFLAKEKIKYLNTPLEEWIKQGIDDRIGKGEKEDKAQNKAHNYKRQMDNKIKDQSIQALTDLILVASSCSAKQNRDIFSLEDVATFISAVVNKIGRDETPGGVYYSRIIHSIVETMNKDELGFDRIDCDVKISPISDVRVGNIDITNIRAERATARHSKFKKID